MKKKSEEMNDAKKKGKRFRKKGKQKEKLLN
jgi:hypothetical protein